MKQSCYGRALLVVATLVLFSALLIRNAPSEVIPPLETDQYWGYKQFSGSIFFVAPINLSNGSITTESLATNIMLTGVRHDSFAIIPQKTSSMCFYGCDTHSCFVNGLPISGSHPENFSVLGECLSMDNNATYFVDSILQTSQEPLSQIQETNIGTWWKTSNSLFFLSYGLSISPDQEDYYYGSSFLLSGKSYLEYFAYHLPLQDENSIVSNSVGFLSANGRLYYMGIELEDLTAQDIVFLGDMYVRDNESLYAGHIKLPIQNVTSTIVSGQYLITTEAVYFGNFLVSYDIENFRILGNGGYARDQDTIYHGGIAMTGVDHASFFVLPREDAYQNIAKDKNNIYSNGVIIPTCHPSSENKKSDYRHMCSYYWSFYDGIK